MAGKTQTIPSIRRAYRATVWGMGAIAISALAAVAAPLALVIAREPQAQSALAGVLAACGCTAAVQTVERHWELIAYAAAAAAAGWAGFGAIRAGRVLRETRHFIRCCRTLSGAGADRLRRVRAYWGIPYDVRAIDTDAVIAASHGTWNPRIVVSRGALQLLTDSELGAVLLHEEAHVRGRDPLLHYGIAVLQRCCGWIPGILALIERYRLYAELRADAWAIERGSGREPLISALASILDAHAPVGATAAFAGRLDMGARIGWLADGTRPRHRSVLVPVAAAAILCAAVIISAISVRGASASSATQEITRCVESRARVIPYCAAAVDNGRFDAMTPFYYTY